MTVQISTRTLNQVALDGFDEAARLVVRDAQSTARRTARSDTGAYRDSFVGAKCGEGVWGFGSTVEYAEFLELGTRPYTYSPEQSVPLGRGDGIEYRFLGTRAGIEADPVLQDSVDRAIRRVLR